MQRTFDTIVIAIILIASQYLCSSIASKNDDEEHQRSKRFVFLKGSGIGVSLEFGFQLKNFFLIVIYLSIWLRWPFQRVQ